MYKIGDKIIHQLEGACLITGQTQLAADNATKEYFIMKPVYNEKNIVYIPKEMNNCKRIRMAITQKQLKEFEHVIKSYGKSWINDYKKRHKSYREMIDRFDFLEVFLILKDLTIQNDQKPLREMDKQFLHLSQKLVFSEVSIVANQNYKLVAQRVNSSFID